MRTLLLGFASAFACPLFVSASIALNPGKGKVMAADVRSEVIALSDQFASWDGSGEDEGVGDVVTPFAYKVEVIEEVPVAKIEETPTEPEEVTVIRYDDASVLDAVSKNFRGRVRGIISRGSNSFLQLSGGTLLRPGSTFPVKLPTVEDQTFDLTVTKITDNTYTLQIGTAVKTIDLNERSSSGSGSTFNR